MKILTVVVISLSAFATKVMATDVCSLETLRIPMQTQPANFITIGEPGVIFDAKRIPFKDITEALISLQNLIDNGQCSVKVQACSMKSERHFKDKLPRHFVIIGKQQVLVSSIGEGLTVLDTLTEKGICQKKVADCKVTSFRENPLDEPEAYVIVNANHWISLSHPAEAANIIMELGNRGMCQITSEICSQKVDYDGYHLEIGKRELIHKTQVESDRSLSDLKNIGLCR